MISRSYRHCDIISNVLWVLVKVIMWFDVIWYYSQHNLSSHILSFLTFEECTKFSSRVWNLSLTLRPFECIRIFPIACCIAVNVAIAGNMRSFILNVENEAIQRCYASFTSYEKLFPNDIKSRSIPEISFFLVANSFCLCRKSDIFLYFIFFFFAKETKISLVWNDTYTYYFFLRRKFQPWRISRLKRFADFDDIMMTSRYVALFPNKILLQVLRISFQTQYITVPKKVFHFCENV